jgi:hypothetical protein
MDMKWWVVAFALLTGCTSMEWNPEDHHVSIETISSEHAEISEVSIRKVEKGVTVFGEVSPSRLAQEIQSGHVNIAVIAPHDVTMFEVNASYYRIGKLFKNPQLYSLSVVIPVTPPKGSKIRIKVEGDP